MNGHYLKPKRSSKKLSWALSLAVSLSGALLLPGTASAQEALTWARIDFLRNRVQFVPQDQQSRSARISDVLSVGDALRTARASRAELRFNDGSLARIGERATFRFTPNTRNFQLSNGTILLLIPPGRGRSTIQTPNAVTGIQGSALFVRYIPETDTTIVGALTNNPDGPMVLFNRDGTEQQALRANEIGVIQGNQITELYEFDGTLFWQSSGLAEGFNYLSDSSSAGSADPLNEVRREIREAISNQGRISGDNVITNPDAFVGPSTDIDENIEIEEQETPALEFENSPAQEYLDSSAEGVDERQLEIGVNNNLAPQASTEDPKKPTTEVTPNESDSITAEEDDEEPSATEPSDPKPSATEPSATEPSATEPLDTDSSDTDSSDADSSDTGTPSTNPTDADSLETDSPDNEASTETDTGSVGTEQESGPNVSGGADNNGSPEDNSTDSTSGGNAVPPSQNNSTPGGNDTGNDSNAEPPTAPSAPAPTAPSAPAPTAPSSPAPIAPSSPASPAPTSPAESPANFAPGATTVPTTTVPTTTVPTATEPIEGAEGALPIQAVPEEVEQLNELQVTNDSETVNDSSPLEADTANPPSTGQDGVTPDTDGNTQGAALSVPGDDNSQGDNTP